MTHRRLPIGPWPWTDVRARPAPAATTRSVPATPTPPAPDGRESRKGIPVSIFRHARTDPPQTVPRRRGGRRRRAGRRHRRLLLQQHHRRVVHRRSAAAASAASAGQACRTPPVPPPPPQPAPPQTPCASATSRTSPTPPPCSASQTAPSRKRSATPSSRPRRSTPARPPSRRCCPAPSTPRFIGPNPAINAFVKSNGDALRIVAGATNNGAALVVKPEINGPADLKGKTLATPQLGGTQDVALRKWLLDNGLKVQTTGGDDVDIVNQENAQTLDLFKSGEIDGAWLPGAVGVPAGRSRPAARPWSTRRPCGRTRSSRPRS